MLFCVKAAPIMTGNTEATSSARRPLESTPASSAQHRCGRKEACCCGGCAWAGVEPASAAAKRCAVLWPHVCDHSTRRRCRQAASKRQRTHLCWAASGCGEPYPAALPPLQKHEQAGDHIRAGPGARCGFSCDAQRSAGACKCLAPTSPPAPHPSCAHQRHARRGPTQAHQCCAGKHLPAGRLSTVSQAHVC